MPLPRSIRSHIPASLKDSRPLRAVALASGLIPPRPMHTAAEADALRAAALRASCVVELGVYEGSSAVVLCDALGPEAQLHLVDPFMDESGWAMRTGWQGTPFATRRAVARHARGGPAIHWHVARSQDVGRAWTGPPVDLVFIDGDHSPEGCGEDWDVWHPHVAPGGRVAFHDARLKRPGGEGSSPGPTSVVEGLRERPPAGFEITNEVDSLVVFTRS